MRNKITKKNKQTNKKASHLHLSAYTQLVIPPQKMALNSGEKTNKTKTTLEAKMSLALTRRLTELVYGQ